MFVGETNTSSVA